MRYRATPPVVAGAGAPALNGELLNVDAMTTPNDAESGRDLVAAGQCPENADRQVRPGGRFRVSVRQSLAARRASYLACRKRRCRCVHSLTIDARWRNVAKGSLSRLERQDPTPDEPT